MKWDRWMFAVASLTAVALVTFAGTARATEYFDNQRGEIQARLSTQNTFQHDAVRNIDWVQWRNELRFDLKYELVKQGEIVGPFRMANFNMLYRGRYDPVFELKDAYKDRNYDRANFMLPEGKIPRELFLDLGFTGALSPLSLRLGRQQVVWGEADVFRSIDIVNPLRIDQSGFVGEDLADLREPLWIAKALWDLGTLGPLSEAGLEVFYSPNGRPQQDRPWLLFGETWKMHINQHNVLDGFDRNIVLPFQQVRHPWEIGRVGARNTDSPAVVQQADGTYADFAYQIKNDVADRQIDFKDASMFGVRLLGTTIGNAYITLNYLWKRSDAAGSAVVFEDIFDPAALDPVTGVNTGAIPSRPGAPPVQEAILADAVAAIGTQDTDGNGIPQGVEQQMRDCFNKVRPVLMIDDGNPATSWDGSIYSDPSNPSLHTGRNNVSYAPVLPQGPTDDGLSHATGCLQIPLWHPWTHVVGFTLTYNDYDITGAVLRLEQSFSTKEARNGNSPNSPARLLEEANGGQLALPNVRDFDTHNMRTTQVWRSMVGFDYLRALAPQSGRGLPQPLRSLATDQWFFTFQFLNEYYAHAEQVNSNTSFTNRMHHFNPLLTYAMTGFFMNQRLRPTLIAALDVNEMFPLFVLQAQYYITPKLELRVGEIIYAGSKNDETNSGLHFYADRDTLFARITYFLL